MPQFARSSVPATLGLVLAGGLARRMGGGDKPLIRIGGTAILERAVGRLQPGCVRLVISANGDPARFVGFGLPVIPDSAPDFLGPLAGLLAGLDWAAQHLPGIDWMASAPGDCPFLPRDLVPRLHEVRAAAGTALACARSNGRPHPTVGLWPVALREDLRHALLDEGLRKVQTWTARHGIAYADWPVTEVDPFFNVNTPEDLARAEELARSESTA